MKMTYLVPAACFAAPPEPEGEMGGWTGGTNRRRGEARQRGLRKGRRKEARQAGE